jgi:carbon-monoxide dehydrogenase large subunit
VPPGATILPGGANAALEVAKETEAASTRGPDGRWKMTLHTAMGAQSMFAIFATEGDILTGRLESDQGNQDFAGTFEGGQLKWDMKVTKPVSITLKYDLAIDGDTITGKCKMGLFGTARVSGERTR